MLAVRYPRPYYDACKLQDKLMQVADNPPPRELANLCKAYATLETLKLRLRMKPAPKPVDVSKDLKPAKRFIMPSPSETA